MARPLESFFSDVDRDAIRAATAEAERTTAAELVVYVTDRCDPHPESVWKAALIGGALGALIATMAVWSFGGWGAPDYLWILIGLQLGLIMGWLASRVESVSRRLIDSEALESRVEGRAAEAFVEEQVFATDERTGVLIFVTLFEHRVLVLADEGISARVDASVWGLISNELAQGIRAGSPAPALVRAIHSCEELLQAHGVTAPDERNQLPNEPRFRRD